MNKVIIYSRPRSMSTWLARFLGGYHDVSGHCKSVEDFHKYPIIVDTLLALYHNGVKEKFPNTKFYVLYRDEKECKESLERLGHPVDNIFYSVSSQIEQLKETLPVIFFDRLQDREYIKSVYKETLGTECSDEYAQEFLFSKIETKLEDFWNYLKGS